MKPNQPPHIEPEERNSEQEPVLTEEGNVTDSFKNPLGIPVKPRDYSRPNVKVTQEQLTTPIAEPAASAPPIDLTKPKPKEEPVSRPEEPDKPHEPFNPQMSKLKGKDHRAAAERAVDAILDGWALLKSLSNKIVTISEKKLKTLHTQGKIDLRIPVPYDEQGNVMPLKEYIQIFNEQNSTIVFDEESRAQLKPVMVKYFEDQGIGMTTKDELVYYGIKELITTGIQIWQGLAMKKDMIKTLQELTKAYKSGSAENFASHPPPPPPKNNQGAENDESGPIVTPWPGENGANKSDVVTDLDVLQDDHNKIHSDERPDYTEPPPAKIPLGMMGADAALELTGADKNVGNIVQKKRGPGRPTKEQAEQRKKAAANSKA